MGFIRFALNWISFLKPKIVPIIGCLILLGMGIRGEWLFCSFWSRPGAFRSVFMIKWLTYLRVLQGEKILKIHPCIVLKSKQEAYLLQKSTYLCWTLTVPIATTHSFGFKTVPLLKVKPRLFNLAIVCVRLTGRTWLITDEFSDSGFPVCTLPIMQVPLGEQELLVNQPLMWEPQRPGQENCFSLILHVFELRNQSPWMWLLGEPCCLPACLRRKGRIRRDKKREMYATSFRTTGPLESSLAALYKACMHKELLQIWSHASLHCVYFTVREGTFGSFVTLTFWLSKDNIKA